MNNENPFQYQIKSISFLGLGSSQPDKVIINPWNRRYKKNKDFVPEPDGVWDDTIVRQSRSEFPYKEKNRAYNLHPQGEYTLLEDVFLSAELIMEIAYESNSVMEFIEKIIDEIHGCTKNILNLIRTQLSNVKSNKISSNKIGYFDASNIENLGNDEKNYYTFDLFDLREKLRGIEVESDLSDSFSEYAFLKNRGSIKSSSNIFYMDKNYYNNNGTLIQNPQKYNLEELDKKKFENNVKHYLDGNLSTLAWEETSQFKSEDLLVGDDSPSQYVRNALSISQKYQIAFESLMDQKKQRLIDLYNGEDLDKLEVDGSIAFLAYINAYFDVLLDIYSLTFDYISDGSGNTIIPLKTDITVDGIAGILTGQSFKVDLESFPMSYNVQNTSPLFVVSTLNHEFTGNDWSTTIGAVLFVPPQAKTEAIYDSSNLQTIISNKNARLKIINNIFVERINEIIKKETNG